MHGRVDRIARDLCSTVEQRVRSKSGSRLVVIVFFTAQAGVTSSKVVRVQIAAVGVIWYA